MVVSVKAASLNFPDVLIIENKYQFKPPLPFSPGSELAGIVKAVGEGVTGLRPGDRVMALTIYGAFAEEISGRGRAACCRCPRASILATASALLADLRHDGPRAARSRRAAARARPSSCSAPSGGIGIASIEIAKAMGARVLAAASSDDKLAVCREHGADAVVNYATADLRERIKTFTGGEGVDVICDPVGGPYTEPALRSIAWRGRLLVVGFAAGEIPQMPLNLALLKGCSIVGVFWGEFLRREPAGSRRASRSLAAWYGAGKITPHVSATFELDHAIDALKLMAARKVVGKVVITM